MPGARSLRDCFSEAVDVAVVDLEGREGCFCFDFW